MKLRFSLLVILFSAVSILGQAKVEDGVAFYRSGDFDKAIETLKAVTAADKKNSTAWVYLGAALLRNGRQKEATSAFSKVNGTKQLVIPGDDSSAKIVSRERVHYTDEARNALATGTIRLAVELGSDGKIGFVYAFQALPYGLTENAISAAKRMKFDPAMKNGKPVTTVVTIEHTFDVH